MGSVGVQSSNWLTDSYLKILRKDPRYKTLVDKRMFEELAVQVSTECVDAATPPDVSQKALRFEQLCHDEMWDKEKMCYYKENKTAGQLKKEATRWFGLTKKLHELEKKKHQLSEDEKTRARIWTPEEWHERLQPVNRKTKKLTVPA